jgi:acyl dehydratase
VATCVGRKARHPFVVDEAAMDRFRQMSGDNSRIHCDDTFARSMGYDGVIVYGGIMLAHLSQLLGMNIPGMNATSISWSIRSHRRRVSSKGDSASQPATRKSPPERRKV